MRVGILITIFFSIWMTPSLAKESCPKIDNNSCYCKMTNKIVPLTNEQDLKSCEDDFLKASLQAALFQGQNELEKLNKSKIKYKCSDFENSTSCPSTIATQLAKDFEDGWSFLELKASSPWNKCLWALDGLKDFSSAKELEKRLSENDLSELGLPQNFITDSSLKQCFPGENPDSFISKLPGDKKARSDLFEKALVADTYSSLLRLGREQKNLIQELSYLNATLDLSPEDGLDCSAISLPRLKEECLSMKNSCDKTSSFSQVKDELFENAIEPMMALNAAKKKRGISKERKKEIEQYEELLKATYPIIMGDDIQNFLKSGKKAGFEASLKKQFQNNKKLLQKEIARNNNDQRCILKNEGQCDDLNKHISKAPSANLFNAYSHEENKGASKEEKLKRLGIRNVSTLHWCLDTHRELKEDASNFSKDLAINAGLTIATGALTATTGVGGLASGSILAARLGLSATRVVTISRAAILGTDSFFFAEGIKDAARVCSDYEIEIGNQSSEHLSKKWSELSCPNDSSLSQANKVKDYKTCLISSSFAALGALPFVPAVVNKVRATKQNEKVSAIYKNITGQDIQSVEELRRITRVLKNSTLSDENRIKAALKLSTIKGLTNKQKSAIILAHNHGQSGMFKYTSAELREKAKILRESGFNKKQIDELMREGITGKTKLEDLDPELLEYAKKIAQQEAIVEFDGLKAIVAPKLQRSLTQFKSVAEEKHYRGIKAISNKFIEIKNRADDPKALDYIDSNKLERFYIAIKKQLGNEGNIRAVDYERFKETIDDGIIPAGSYFSRTDQGAHVGHNNGFLFLKCKSNCNDIFESADTGSGMQNIRNIKIEDVELIVPDFDKAAKEAGIQ